MGFKFRKAVRENAHVIIGLGGGTGSGKTFSAMRLAAGLSSGKRFAVIDTEAGRATHYADRFDFDHGDLSAPFRPDAYREAIEAAEQAGYPVIVVDSISHEQAGPGGLNEWHEELWAAKNHSDKHKIQSWIIPKVSHGKLVQKLLQLRAHLILCFRAKNTLEIDGKKYETTWKAVIEKNLPFEMTASFMLHHEKPGLPSEPLKLGVDLRPYFDPRREIDEAAGAGILAWATGGAPPDDKGISAPLADAYGAIAGCRTRGELDHVGAGLKDAGLGESDLVRARAAFKTRAAELGGAS